MKYLHLKESFKKKCHHTYIRYLLFFFKQKVFKYYVMKLRGMHKMNQALFINCTNLQQIYVA